MYLEDTGEVLGVVTRYRYKIQAGRYRAMLCLYITRYFTVFQVHMYLRCRCFDLLSRCHILVNQLQLTTTNLNV